MAHENIQSANPYFTIDSDGYFCDFNTTLNVFEKSTQTAATVFTYPSLDNFKDGTYGAILDICYDGSHFWTLNKEGSTRRFWTEYTYDDVTTHDARYVYDYSIRKWAIGTNNILNKLAQFDIVNSDRTDVVVPTSFSVESYQTVYSATVSGNTPYVKMVDHWDNARLEAGDILFLGPNAAGQSEFVTVTGTIGPNTVGLTFYTNYTYEAGDSITFNKAIHLFNQFCPSSDDYATKGSWIMYNVDDGSLINRTFDSEYKNITACTFNYTDSLVTRPNFYSLVYIKNNSAKFINISTMAVELVMNIDNIQANGSTVIPIFDLEIRNGSLYRLQKRSMYYETDYTWATYNYVVSPIREYLDSITLSVYPTVLPSNGVSTAQVMAIVHDQYADLKNNVIITLEDNNDTGFMAHRVVYSNSFGVALGTYFSGVSPANVTITATALQDV